MVKLLLQALLHQLFMNMGYVAGLISTVENKIGHTVLRLPIRHQMLK
jgi:hypothetical protein